MLSHCAATSMSFSLSPAKCSMSSRNVYRCIGDFMARHDQLWIRQRWRTYNMSSGPGLTGGGLIPSKKRRMMSTIKCHSEFLNCNYKMLRINSETCSVKDMKYNISLSLLTYGNIINNEMNLSIYPSSLSCNPRLSGKKILTRPTLQFFFGTTSDT